MPGLSVRQCTTASARPGMDKLTSTHRSPVSLERSPSVPLSQPKSRRGVNSAGPRQSECDRTVTTVLGTSLARTQLHRVSAEAFDVRTRRRQRRGTAAER